MAEVYTVEASVKLKGDKVSINAFVNQLERDIEGKISKLGLGKISTGISKTVGAETKGGMGIGSALTQGAAMGAMAGGVMAIAGILTDALKDMPIISAIMKIFKIILVLLFLPLIPILKPVLLGLAEFCKAFAPKMKAVADAVGKGIEGIKKLTALEGLTGISGLRDKVIGQINSWVESVFGTGTAGKVIKFIADWYANLYLSLLEISVRFALWLKSIFTGANITKAVDWFLEGLGFWIGRFFRVTFDFFTWLGQKLSDWWNALIKFDWWTWIETNVTAWWNGLKTFNFWEWLTGNFERWWNSLKSWDFWGWLQGRITAYLGGITKGLSSTKQLGGVISETGMYLMHRGERVATPTERTTPTGGRDVTVNINIDRPSVRSDKDIKDLVKQINFEQQRAMRRYVSYA